MIADLKFYLTLFLRRLHYFLAVFVGVTAVGGYVAMSLPDVYRAEGRMVVEAPQIPDDLAASTVRADSSELLGVIQQRLFTRDNLHDLAQRFEVFENMEEMTKDEIVGRMRDGIQFTIPNRAQATGVVVVGFNAAKAETTAAVVNELLAQILVQNIEMRTGASRETLEFFENEVARLDAELAQQGARILEFQLQNQNALPESLDYQRSRVTSLQERVLQINREFSSLTDRRARLTELYEQTGRIDLSDASLTPEQRRLRDLQGELASAMVIYAPQNPRVVALRTQVEALQQQVAAQTDPGSSNRALLTAYDLQISDIDGQIAFLSEQKVLIEEELEQLLTQISATPENAITLSTLERDYDNIRTQFNQATVGLAEARTGERIETLSKGQRVVVIEDASIPADPWAPNRQLILSASLAVGAAAGFTLVFLLELLNSAIRRPVELTRAFGDKPFATLPYIRTPGQAARQRLGIAGGIVASSVLVPVVLYTVHQQVMPLQRVVEIVRFATGI